jgi:hypothetical protein
MLGPPLRPHRTAGAGDFRLRVRGDAYLDTLEADLEEVIDCELDRVTNP